MVELIDKTGTPIRGYSGSTVAVVERSGLRQKVSWGDNAFMRFRNPQFHVRMRITGAGATRVKFYAAYIE